MATTRRQVDGLQKLLLDLRDYLDRLGAYLEMADPLVAAQVDIPLPPTLAGGCYLLPHARRGIVLVARLHRPCEVRP
jgi:hypothetical protein